MYGIKIQASLKVDIEHSPPTPSTYSTLDLVSVFRLVGLHLRCHGLVFRQ